MHIFIRDVRNNSFEIDVQDDCTVPLLKQAIAEHKHCSIDGIKLLFASKILHDDFDLKSIQTNEKSRIVLYVKPEKNNTSPTKLSEPVSAPVREEPKPAPPVEPMKPQPKPVQSPPAQPQQPKITPMQQQPMDQQPISREIVQMYEEQSPDSLEKTISAMTEMGYDKEVARVALTLLDNDVESAIDVISRGYDTIEKLQNYEADYRAKYRTYFDSLYAHIIQNPELIRYVIQHHTCPVTLPNGTMTFTKINYDDFINYCNKHGLNITKGDVILLQPEQVQLFQQLIHEFPNVEQYTILQYLQACDFDLSNTRACLQNE